jgi:hypothetical protein
MSATAETTQQFKCSCGRTFVHELSLKRHRWVTGHVESEAGEAAAATSEAPAPVQEAPTAQVDAARAEQAYFEALEILRAKRLEQEQFEQQQALTESVSVVGEFVDWAGQSVYQGVMHTAEVAKSTAASGLAFAGQVLRVMLLMVFMFGLVSAGVGVGKLVATSTGSGMTQPAVWTVSQG